MSSLEKPKIEDIIKQSYNISLNKKDLETDFGKFSEIKSVLFLINDLNNVQRKNIEMYDIDIITLQTLFKKNSAFTRIKKSQLNEILDLNNKMFYNM